jgi:hypothetical protein
MSTVTTFLLSFASMVDVMKTDLSATVGAAASSFTICFLCGFLLAQECAFITPLFFSFRKISDDSAFFLSSSDRSLACFGSKTPYLLNWSSYLVIAVSPHSPNRLIPASSWYYPDLGLYFFFFFFTPSFSS